MSIVDNPGQECPWKRGGSPLPRLGWLLVSIAAYDHSCERFWAALGPWKGTAEAQGGSTRPAAAPRTVPSHELSRDGSAQVSGRKPTLPRLKARNGTRGKRRLNDAAPL